jgi:lysyl-tRNA synthetase class 1
MEKTWTFPVHGWQLQAPVEGRLGNALDGAGSRLRDGWQGLDRLGHDLSSTICAALGRTPPKGFIYELFLDKDGHKISKSRRATA